jgi:hypothetical protein
MEQDAVGSGFFIGVCAPQCLLLAKAGDKRFRSSESAGPEKRS